MRGRFEVLGSVHDELVIGRLQAKRPEGSCCVGLRPKSIYWMRSDERSASYEDVKEKH